MHEMHRQDRRREAIGGAPLWVVARTRKVADWTACTSRPPET
jgi:hypothetical protein